MSFLDLFEWAAMELTKNLFKPYGVKLDGIGNQLLAGIRH
jgi:hypothetical protein